MLFRRLSCESSNDLSRGLTGLSPRRPRHKIRLIHNISRGGPFPCLLVSVNVGSVSIPRTYTLMYFIAIFVAIILYLVAAIHCYVLTDDTCWILLL